MVMVDVYAPALDREYNFSLDSGIRIQILIEEMAEMIAHKENTLLVGNPEKLTLYCQDQKRRLPQNGTLESENVTVGSKLILL